MERALRRNDGFPIFQLIPYSGESLNSTQSIGGARGTVFLGPGEAGTGPGSVPRAHNSSPGTCLQLQDAELDVNQQLDNEQTPLLGMRNSLLQSHEIGGIKLPERSLGRRERFDSTKILGKADFAFHTLPYGFNWITSTNVGVPRSSGPCHFCATSSQKMKAPQLSSSL